MLRYERVSKVYPGEVTALADFSLEVQQGEFIVLIGPSGSGKTTALKTTNRLIEPTDGRILFDGRDVRAMDPLQLRHQMGYALQGTGLFPHLTVAENIAIVPEVLGWPLVQRRDRVDELLHLAGLDPEDYRDRYPHELSGGQQQRVGVLRALAADPPLILMDEPFGALDPITRNDLQDELMRLQRTVHKTILFVTHDMHEAMKLADRIVVMNEGRIAKVGTPRQLMAETDNPFVTQFLQTTTVSLTPEPLALAQFMEPGSGVGPEQPALFTPDMPAHEAVERMNRMGLKTATVTDHSGAAVGLIRLERVASALVAHAWGGKVDEAAD